MKCIAHRIAILFAGIAIAMTACTSVNQQPAESASTTAENALRVQIRHGAIATIATAEAFTELLARSTATEKARANLTDAVDLQVAHLKQELLHGIRADHANRANSFFNAVSKDMRRKVPLTSRVVFTIEERTDNRARGYAVVVQNPSLVLAYLDLHGEDHPTVYPLLRAGKGYQQLSQNAATYKQFLAASKN